jgi:hypothetical protein
MNQIKKIAFITFLMLCGYTNYAQNCNDSNVNKLPGKWQLNNGWTSAEDTKNDVLKEKPIADAIMESIKKNFPWTPVGGRIFYGTRGSFDRRPIPLRRLCKDYGVQFDYNHYFCGGGKVYYEEGVNALRVYFNNLPFTFENSFYTPGPNVKETDTDPETDKYEILHWLPNVKEGYFDYIVDQVDGTGTEPLLSQVSSLIA